MKEAHTCCALIYHAGFNFARPHVCGRKAKIEGKPGHWYCGIHDPAKKAARRAATQAKYEAEFARRKTERLYGVYGIELIEALKYVTVRLSLYGDLDVIRRANDLIAKIEAEAETIT